MLASDQKRLRLELACHVNWHKGVIDARQPSSWKVIANCQSFSSVRSQVRRLVIGRPSTGVTSSYVQTSNADPYTQARVRRRRELVAEFSFLVELLWQSWCGRLLSSSEFNQQLQESMHYSTFKGWQMVLLLNSKTFTKRFASNWLEILKKAGMQLDCPETGIIHLYQLI